MKFEYFFLVIQIIAIVWLARNYRREKALNEYYLSQYRKYEDAYWKCHIQRLNEQSQEEKDEIKAARLILKREDFLNDHKL